MEFKAYKILQSFYSLVLFSFKKVYHANAIFPIKKEPSAHFYLSLIGMYCRFVTTLLYAGLIIF